MRATPSAKNLASQHRLDLGKIEGTGTRGLITVGDVLERINFQPGMEQSKGHKGDVPTPGDERRDFFGVRRGPMKIPTDRSEPGGWGLAGGSITLLGIIGAIVLITAVFSLSLGWTIGLNIGLVIVGLVFAGATIEGWRDRRLFRDTAVVVPGKIFQRMHEQHEDSYGEVSHEYYL